MQISCNDAPILRYFKRLRLSRGTQLRNESQTSFFCAVIATSFTSVSFFNFSHAYIVHMTELVYIDRWRSEKI